MNPANFVVIISYAINATDTLPLVNIHGAQPLWQQTYQRCRQFAHQLKI